MTDRERLLRKVSGGELPRSPMEFPDGNTQFCIMNDTSEKCIDCGHHKQVNLVGAMECEHPKQAGSRKFPACAKTCPMESDY